MAITTRDGIVAALKQKLPFQKTASRTSVANIPFSVFGLAGNPGAGTLAIGNTDNGVVPTDATAGYPLINPFSGANTGYISGARVLNSVASWIHVYDRVFAAGAYSFNSNVTLASQPSYAGRIPDANYIGTELWVETVTAFTGNLSVAVGYTNQSGTSGRSTGTVATGVAPTVGRCIQLPFQSGDCGIQSVNSVVASVATVGTFNVMVLRPLFSFRVNAVNFGDVLDWAKIGLPQIYADSAIYVMVQADSTSTGLPSLLLDVING